MPLPESEEHAQQSCNQVTYQPGHSEGVPHFLSAFLHLSTGGPITSYASEVLASGSMTGSKLIQGGGRPHSYIHNILKRNSTRVRLMGEPQQTEGGQAGERWIIEPQHS
ncbi:hypothetical protein ATANTOWER_008701 [Ataeniobius toweri]|uniref:Uncharacterized protein n=1 Tax=Ataeniobius toweri TaxID=208326 RepID=A0ABU7B462_9TELE|nr:hypothetical protein [Ataeniobius toweri]